MPSAEFVNLHGLTSSVNQPREAGFGKISARGTADAWPSSPAPSLGSRRAAPLRVPVCGHPSVCAPSIRRRAVRPPFHWLSV